MKKAIILIFLTIALSLIALANEPKAIIVTPPAPKFTDAERQAELSKRRATVLEKMSPNSILIIWSATPRNYAGDVDFMFRQENNHYYLTSLKQVNSTLVLIKGATKSQEILFLPERNPQFETWNGKMYSNAEATKFSGVKTIIDSTELTTFITALGKKEAFTSKNNVSLANSAESIYLLMPYTEGDSDGMAEFKREQDFAKTLPNYKIVNARPIIDKMRLIKSTYEIKLLQHAIDITSEAQMRSMGMVNKASWEYEVQAEVEYTFRRRNAEYWGYPSIVGCGPNATTLHYVESQGEIKKGELLLMDVGAEYDHYTADVTRTFPTNGKFTKEQAEIYQIVYDAQEAAAKTIKPGSTVGVASQAADEVIREGLFKLGLTTDKNSQQHRIWYMHGWGHWLGMNVHDVGNYSTPLQPGMVMTNEPGIYIREDALEYLPKTPEWQIFIAKVKPNFDKYKNIGVRIEDDMLVTETGVEWMTKALPREINQVQAFMEKAKVEMQTAEIERIINPTFATIDFGRMYQLKESFSGDYPSGKTIRSGWVSGGKEIAYSGLSHSGH